MFLSISTIYSLLFLLFLSYLSFIYDIGFLYNRKIKNLLKHAHLRFCDLICLFSLSGHILSLQSLPLRDLLYLFSLSRHILSLQSLLLRDLLYLFGLSRHILKIFAEKPSQMANYSVLVRPYLKACKFVHLLCYLQSAYWT